MKLLTAMHRLNECDFRVGKVFSHADMRTLFPEDGQKTLQAGINRLVDGGILERVAKGVYVYQMSHHGDRRTLEGIAAVLRRGAFSYVSLESALSEWGVISQVAMRLTVMTTGRKGLFECSYGIIEFTHTAKPLMQAFEGTACDPSRPLRIAGKHKAYQDLVRVGRSLHLVDHEELRDAEN
ncbi:MAG: hypothetical protein OXE83_02495 [Gammaproteobacteria bacterium]|nr:hypothetical protein [Gammaproteobacteria bacterium]